MQGADSSKTRIYIVIFLLSIFANVILFFTLIDKSISLDYVKNEQKFLTKRSLDTLSILSELSIGFPKENFRIITSSLISRGIIVKERSTEIQAGDIVFQFKNGKVVNAYYIK